MRNPDPPVLFTPEDVERILKALFPAGGPDPFGQIEELIVQLAEEIESGKTAEELWHTEVREELGDIKARTFGILLLQIFKVLGFFMRLLPQARIIIIVVAAIGLVDSLLSDGQVSPEAIKRAVKATGLQQFIDQILEQLNGLVDEIANNASQLADVTSQVFVSIAGELEVAEGKLEAELRHLTGITLDRVEPTQEELLNALQSTVSGLQDILPGLTQAANAASNSDLFIGPALRGLDDRMREIPTMALRLVRLA